MDRKQKPTKATLQGARSILQGTMNTRWYYIDQQVLLAQDGDGTAILMFRNGGAPKEHCAEVARRSGFDLDQEREGYWTLRRNQGCELL